MLREACVTPLPPFCLWTSPVHTQDQQIHGWCHLHSLSSAIAWRSTESCLASLWIRSLCPSSNSAHLQTAVVNKAQQWLHFLRVLRRNKLKEKLLVSFYSATTESVVTYCISVWYAGYHVADRKALQSVIKMAERTIGCRLPSLNEISSSQFPQQKKLKNP